MELNSSGISAIEFNNMAWLFRHILNKKAFPVIHIYGASFINVVRTFKNYFKPLLILPQKPQSTI